MPLGFVALDLAFALGSRCIDPDDRQHHRSRRESTRGRGNGLIGEDDKTPNMVVAANGGSDLIYLPDGDGAWRSGSIDALFDAGLRQRHFRRPQVGKFPGTLSLADIALEGTAVTPSRRLSSASARSTPYAASRCAVPSRSPTPTSDGPRNARIVQPGRHMEFPGDAGPGLQNAFRRSGAVEQRRYRPHHRAPARRRSATATSWSAGC